MFATYLAVLIGGALSVVLPEVAECWKPAGLPPAARPADPPGLRVRFAHVVSVSVRAALMARESAMPCQ